MKANRKFKDGEEAVSAVIGVILMVAITVAIAATVYYYVTTMMPSEGESTPDIIMQKDDVSNTITILSADVNLEWDNIAINTGVTRSGWDYTSRTKAVNAGDTIAITSVGSISVTITWTPSNTLLGSYDFTAG